MNNALRNWKTTAAGVASLLSGLGLLGSIISDLLAGQPPALDKLTAAAGLISAGIAGILAKDGDKSGTAAAPTGFARLALLVGVAIGALFVLGYANMARADEAAIPTLGGTFKVGTVQAAYGPRLLPGMLALDFKSGQVAVVSIGGLAYGCDFYADKPYSIGVAGFLGAQVGGGSVPASISTGVVASLFHYAAIGWHHGVTGGVRSDHFVAGPSVAF